MRLACVLVIMAAIVFCLCVSSALAERKYESVFSEYPTEKFIIGLGETFRTENDLMDARVAEIRARLAIARQINLRISEETIEIMCDGSTGKLFNDWNECRNAFREVIDRMVDQFKQGATIVNTGKKDGVVYAVAVLPRLKATRDMNISIKESLDKTIEAIDLAKLGDMRYLWKAREEYIKTLTYLKEKELIEGKIDHDREFFEKLGKDILQLKKSF